MSNTYDLGPFASTAEAEEACERDLALGATSCEVIARNGQFFARVTEAQAAGDGADKDDERDA
jgi:hypothetical protein